MLPLRRGQTLELLAEFKKVSFSVNVITSGVKAVAALVGYFISRVLHYLPVSFHPWTARRHREPCASPSAILQGLRLTACLLPFSNPYSSDGSLLATAISS